MTSNRLGLVGLALIVAAVAALASFWWAVLVCGVLCVALAYVAHRWEQTVDAVSPDARSELEQRAEEFRRQAA